MHKRGLPRLLWVEEEYRDRIRAAEIDYVRALVRDIESGTSRAPTGGARSTNAVSAAFHRPSPLTTAPNKGNDNRTRLTSQHRTEICAC